MCPLSTGRSDPPAFRSSSPRCPASHIRCPLSLVAESHHYLLLPFPVPASTHADHSPPYSLPPPRSFQTSISRMPPRLVAGLPVRHAPWPLAAVRPSPRFPLPLGGPIPALPGAPVLNPSPSSCADASNSVPPPHA